jgi:hypothetical protein
MHILNQDLLTLEKFALFPKLCMEKEIPQIQYVINVTRMPNFSYQYVSRKNIIVSSAVPRLRQRKVFGLQKISPPPSIHYAKSKKHRCKP